MRPFVRRVDGECEGKFMTKVIRRETRKRGFFGWSFLLLFYAFNALMLWSTIVGLSSVGHSVPDTPEGQAGAALGAALGMGFLLAFWACGAIILGTLVFVTRGSKTIVEETEA